jgi:glycosyltransferase involved in cell wall biosynthesis
LTIQGASARRLTVNVVVPTYRRPEFLYWTLRSILKQRLTNGALIVHVVNNDSQVDDVNEAVERALRAEPAASSSARVNVVHRTPPLPPAESWAKAMLECARDGEILIVHCDDDIMLPGSLENRSRTLGYGRSPFAALLSRDAGMILYKRDENSFHLSRTLDHSLQYSRVNGDAFEARPRDVAVYPGALFSAYAYVLNDAYRETQALYERVLLDVPQTFREGAAIMLPVNFAAAASLRRALLAHPLPVCARGMFFHEYVASDGRVAWDAGYLYLSTLAFLDSLKQLVDADTQALRDLRVIYERQSARWALRFLAGGNLNERIRLIRSVDSGVLRQLPSLLLGIKTFLGGVLAERRLLPHLRRAPTAFVRGEDVFERLGFVAAAASDG